MKTFYKESFKRDIKTLKNSDLKHRISLVILEVENADSVTEIRNIKKLKAYKTAYRIRIGEYRIGLFIEDYIITFTTIRHRKDIYKYFP